MNVKKLKGTIDLFRDALGDALISSDIWDRKDGLSVASYNTNDRFSALFARIIRNTETALAEIDFPSFGEYQLLDLDDDLILLIINSEEGYFWGSLINKEKLSLGALIYINIPKAKASLKEAIEAGY